MTPQVTSPIDLDIAKGIGDLVDLTERVGDDGRESLPVLSPVLVADVDDIDLWVRAERASIARLTLELRSTSSTADDAEGALTTSDIEDDGHSSRGLLDGLVERHIIEIQEQLEARLHSVRAEATSIVSAAKAQATVILEQAAAAISQPMAETAPSVTPMVTHSSAIHSNGSVKRTQGPESTGDALSGLAGSPSINGATRAVVTEEPSVITARVEAIEQMPEVATKSSTKSKIRLVAVLGALVSLDVLLPLGAVLALIVMLLAMVG